MTSNVVLKLFSTQFESTIGLYIMRNKVVRERLQSLIGRTEQLIQQVNSLSQ